MYENTVLQNMYENMVLQNHLQFNGYIKDINLIYRNIEVKMVIYACVNRRRDVIFA